MSIANADYYTRERKLKTHERSEYRLFYNLLYNYIYWLQYSNASQHNSYTSAYNVAAILERNVFLLQSPNANLQYSNAHIKLAAILERISAILEYNSAKPECRAAKPECKCYNTRTQRN